MEDEGGDSASTQLQFPLARIKRIMKKGKDEKNQLSNDAVLIGAKAVELFAEHLLKASNEVMAREGRKTMQYKDISTAVAEKDELDFLIEVIPSKKPMKDILASK